MNYTFRVPTALLGMTVITLQAGCEHLIDVPTNRFELLPTGIRAESEPFGPVQLLDAEGRVVRTLAEHGGGPWRAPDGSAIYFVRYSCVASPQTQPATGTSINGTLYLADPDGEHESPIALPKDLIPCEVGVSHSGRYLVVAGIDVNGPKQGVPGEAVPYVARTLYLLDRHKSVSHKLHAMASPDGIEFGWSPRDDTLALVIPIDLSPAVAAQLLAQLTLFSQHQSATDPPIPPEALSTLAAERPANHEEPGEMFETIMLASPDTLSKAPRNALAIVWRPGQSKSDLDDGVALIRPYYAGFTWLPNGRELLIFSVDGAPRPVRPDLMDAIFPAFVCHRWNPKTGGLEPIPTPRPDAFTALPSPDGRMLLWVCGNQEQSLILTDSAGRQPRTVAQGVPMRHLPYWQDAHTVTFIRIAEKITRNVPDPQTGRLVAQSQEVPPRRVVIDTRTLRSEELELAPSPAFRKREDH